MPPDMVVLRDALTMLAAFLLGLGALIYFLPVGTCSQCTHCRDERLKKAAEQKRLAAAEYCPLCRTYHLPGEGKHNKDDAE